MATCRRGSTVLAIGGLPPITTTIVKPIVLLSLTGAVLSLFFLWISSNSSRVGLHIGGWRRPMTESAGGGGGIPAETMPPPRAFILWLHGLGDSGPANEPIKSFFTSREFAATRWSFPSAPVMPVSCNGTHRHPDPAIPIFSVFPHWLVRIEVSQEDTCLYTNLDYGVSLVGGISMPSWFDIHEIPITADSPKDEEGVMKAVQNVHRMIDNEVAAGVQPENIFLCGFSQGGALTLASVLLYPRRLGGGAIFSGWVPFNSSIIEKIPQDAKKVLFSCLLFSFEIWEPGLDMDPVPWVRVPRVARYPRRFCLLNLDSSKVNVWCNLYAWEIAAQESVGIASVE
ncbi:putative carboxylesterase SOBER1-like [Nymphaea thermarum]|nr:putative carboxylesterase SOBER1-like [Nymphaea thermarum]